MTFDEWLKVGIDNRWCGPIVCTTHDGTPATPEEETAWEEGDDRCISMIRIYESAEQAEQIEQNHSPSVWRKPRYD